MKKEIVLIEDDEILMENVSFFLSSNGFRVFSAMNGKEGVRLIQAHYPDLVLCDINLPDMDGHEIFQSVSEEYSNPFIFLTANTSLEDIRSGLQLGVDDYLTKPFKLKDLLETVNMRLSKASHHKQSSKTAFDLLRSHVQLPFIVLEQDCISEFSDSAKKLGFTQELSVRKEWNTVFDIYEIEEETESHFGKTIQIRSGNLVKRAVQILEPFTSKSWIIFTNELNETDSKSIQSEYNLTDKETEVAQEIATGLTNQEVAEKLSVSVRTVDWHRTNIFSKLNVRNRAEFIIKFSNR